MATYDSEKAAKIHRHIHSNMPSDPALRVKTLESLLVERGIVASATIDTWIEGVVRLNRLEAGGGVP